MSAKCADRQTSARGKAVGGWVVSVLTLVAVIVCLFVCD